MTKAAHPSLPKFEMSRPVDLLEAHKVLVREGGKAVEELHKSAIGISENASTLLAWLAALRLQKTAAVPILNPAVVQKLVGKLEKYEVAMTCLDLSKDVPRTNKDLQEAIRLWLELGRELSKPGYSALLLAMQQQLPYQLGGVYRSMVVAGLASNPGAACASLSPAGEPPEAERAAWASAPTSAACMEAFFSAAVISRVRSLQSQGAPAPPAAPQPEVDGALRALLEVDSDAEEVPPPANALVAALEAALAAWQTLNIRKRKYGVTLEEKLAAVKAAYKTVSEAWYAVPEATAQGIVTAGDLKESLKAKKAAARGLFAA